MQILVVDDKTERRKEIGKLLKDQGYKVVTASDGFVALTKLKHHKRIALVLTDTKMPCLNGPELVEELTPRYPKLLVIGMSNREESRSLFKHFWNKNEDPEILFNLITKLTDN